jgi:hypothetical protein
MYGDNIGALNVYVNSSGVPVWSRKGNQQDRWTVGQLTMNPGQNQQVFFIYHFYFTHKKFLFSD